MRIQYNIAALNSYRQLGNNNNAVAKNLEKLSSGYKINRAGDDAAGLAISEKMRAQITGLETAQKNANDGISLVQTAEGAMTGVHSMLNRMVELADQSANGTYDNNVDRANLQKEVKSLKSEVDRISDGTNFNGINLLDGSLSSSSSVGGLTGGAIINYRGATTDVAGTNASTSSVAATAGKYEVQVKTAFAAGDSVSIGGVNLKFGTGTDEIDTSTAATTDDQAKAIAEKLNADTTFKGTWTATTTGDKVVITNNTAGDTTALAAVGGTTAAKVDQKGTAGTAAPGIDFFQKDTMNIDGTEVKVDWSKLSDIDRASLQKAWQETTAGTAPTASEVKKASDILQNTINSAIDEHNAKNGTSLNQIKVTGTPTDGTNAAVCCMS